MCTFTPITKKEIRSSASYIIATTILNQSEEFTVNKILGDVKQRLGRTAFESKSEVDVEKSVITKLNMLRDNGVVVEHGSYFTLREQMS